MTLARMLEAARLWGDNSRIETVARHIDSLSAFKKGSDLIHRVDEKDRRPARLGDFLAFSDAKLQVYLATGRAAALDEGPAVPEHRQGPLSQHPTGSTQPKPELGGDGGP